MLRIKSATKAFSDLKSLWDQTCQKGSKWPKFLPDEFFQMTSSDEKWWSAIFEKNLDDSKWTKVGPKIAQDLAKIRFSEVLVKVGSLHSEKVLRNEIITLVIWFYDSIYGKVLDQGQVQFQWPQMAKNVTSKYSKSFLLNLDNYFCLKVNFSVAKFVLLYSLISLTANESLGT